MDPRRSLPALAAAAVVLACVCPAAARGDAVTDWNSHANAAIFAAGPPAHSAVLSTAMVQGAVYDAVNAIAGGYEDYLPTPPAHRWYSQDAAAATDGPPAQAARKTADQTMAGLQAQPGGLYGGVMRSLSSRYGLSTAQNARLFAMVSLAAADGAIGCWNDKARWSFWRPIDAIRLAATDGNRRTRADATWTPLFDDDSGADDGGGPGAPVG